MRETGGETTVVDEAAIARALSLARAKPRFPSRRPAPPGSPAR